jgi:hypothetical protein
MENKLKFQMIGERKYYANKSNNVNENIFYVQNKFRLSYYIDFGGFIFAYYMGNYYQCDACVLDMDEIDIVQSIIKECSDPYIYDTENIAVD